MNVSAISQLGGLQAAQAAQSQNASSSGGITMFKDVYNDLISNVNQTDTAFNGDIVKAAQGELDNPQQLTIDGAKATIALQLVSNVRNDALTAYNDVIKMQV